MFLKNIPLFIAVLCFFSCSSQKSQEIADVDFDVSLGASRIGKHFFCKKELDRISYEICHALWNSNRPKKIAKKESSAIPKIIHQLWLSDEPLPEEYKKYQATWLKHHPEWEHHLWTHKDIKKLPESIKTRLTSSLDNREKEELLKAAILFELGGVVIDIAFECFKPLDGFHERYDLYASVEPPLTKPRLGGVLHISPLIIGSIPRHPLIYYWQQQMLQKYDISREEHHPQERALACACLPLDEAVRVLGMDTEYVNIVLPPTYFFPLNGKALKQGALPTKKKKKYFFSFLFEPQKPLFSSIASESYALHHKGGIWTREVIKKKKEPNKNRLQKLLNKK